MDDIQTILRALRQLMPDRQLQRHEAISVAERQAAKLRELLAITEAPIDIARIAELQGIAVTVKPNLTVMNTLSSGASWYDKTGWHIAVNADDSRTRRRFTVGHEIKHIIDDPYIDMLYRGPGDSDKVADGRAEEICDYFAGCLLMPRVTVKRLWAGGMQDQRVLAAQFGVSPAAMAKRLTVLGIVDGRYRHHAGQGWQERSIRSYLRLDRQAVELTPVAA
jgi:Zn-dependent peptidase ImmA (M78 family)